MNDDTAIKVDHLSKVFKEQAGSKSFKQMFVGLAKQKKHHRDMRFTKGEFRALDDVNFEVKQGEFFGIVGKNGGGKSTLLKLLAGVYTPTSGAVGVNGRLTPFIELGVGFNPELSGRDNVFLNGALLGFSRKQMEEMYDDIVAFAELEDFMDVKLKNYSSGMQVRLAFSVAIRAETDILLIDEVLAVGDANFQQKCFDYFKRLKQARKTVVFVSHDRTAISTYCTRCLLVDKGRVLDIGTPDLILRKYEDLLLEGQTNLETSSGKKNDVSQKKTYVKDVAISKPQNGKYFTPLERIGIQVKYQIGETIEAPILGLVIKNALDNTVLVVNTRSRNMQTRTYTDGEEAILEYEFANILGDGSYTIEPAIASANGNIFYDWITSNRKIRVSGNNDKDAVIVYDDKLIVEGVRNEQ